MAVAAYFRYPIECLGKLLRVQDFILGAICTQNAMQDYFATRGEDIMYEGSDDELSTEFKLEASSMEQGAGGLQGAFKAVGIEELGQVRLMIELVQEMMEE